jgi:LETM1 and EF-hand domain-containing protein 1
LAKAVSNCHRRDRITLKCIAASQHFQFSSGSQQDTDKKAEIAKKDKSSSGGFLVVTKNAISATVDFVSNPKQSWAAIKKEALHYWVGSKLLWSEIKIASALISRVFEGHAMTRRERMQLLRTATDIFRLVPFAVFIIVPFMELLLPFALKLFPNMLPSTFQDSLKKEENMKKELQMRLAVAGFLQDTLKELAAKKNHQDSSDTSGAKELIDFIDKARLGKALPNDSVIRIARLFKDELTLANIARPQLVSMCQYMGLNPYGADAFIRFQLRAKIRTIKEDDRRILWEGIDSLTADELRDACRERGMRFMGLTHFGYKRQLQDWLDLSIQKNVPLSLLIMSRAFNLTSTSTPAEDVLKSSISSLTDDTINEVVLAAALPGEEHSIEIQQRKLESLEFQNDMINEERMLSEEARQAKVQQQKVKSESAEKSLNANTTDSSEAILPSRATAKDDKTSSHSISEVATASNQSVEKATSPSERGGETVSFLDLAKVIHVT